MIDNSIVKHPSPSQGLVYFVMMFLLFSYLSLYTGARPKSDCDLEGAKGQFNNFIDAVRIHNTSNEVKISTMGSANESQYLFTAAVVSSDALLYKPLFAIIGIILASASLYTYLIIIAACFVMNDQEKKNRKWAKRFNVLSATAVLSGAFSSVIIVVVGISDINLLIGLLK